MDAHSPDTIRPTRQPLHEALLAWPGFPPYVVEKIVDLEHELDQIHPGWRTRQRFDQVAYESKARIKWCLKRLSLLTHTSGGLPDPLDWDVIIVQDKRNQKQCYAHPVIPAITQGGDVTRDPPSPLGKVAPQVDPHVMFSRPPLGSPEVVAPRLAASMGLPEDVVLADLRAKPRGWMEDDAAWVDVCHRRRTASTEAAITFVAGLQEDAALALEPPKKKPSRKKQSPLVHKEP